MIIKLLLIGFYGLVLYNFILLDIGNIYNFNITSWDFILFVSNFIIAFIGIGILFFLNLKNKLLQNNLKNTFYSVFYLYIFLIVGFFISQEYLIANRTMLTVTKLSGVLSFLLLSVGLSVSPVLYFIKNIKIKLFLILSRKLLGILMFIIVIRHVIDFFITHYPYGEGFLDYFNYFISQIQYPVIWSGTVGTVAVVLLGITSNKIACMKMKKWWKKLHMLVFPIYLFSMLHVWYLGRLDWFYWGITVSIILMRVGVFILKKRKNEKNKQNIAFTAIVIYIIAFLEGFTTLSVEIVALRNFTPIVGINSISTSIILGVILLALSYGYYMGGKISSSGKKIEYTLVKNLLLASVYYFAISFTLDRYLLEYLLGTTQSYFFSILLSSIVLFFVPVFLASQTIPLLSELLAGKNTGEKMGKLLFYSTVGSFVGAVGTSAFFFPLIGVLKTGLLSSIILSFCAVLIFKICIKK